MKPLGSGNKFAICDWLTERANQADQQCRANSHLLLAPLVRALEAREIRNSEASARRYLKTTAVRAITAQAGGICLRWRGGSASRQCLPLSRRWPRTTSSQYWLSSRTF